jgi:hypothetical protein
MLPSVYNLPTGYRNDTYGPINFRFTNATGGAVDISGAVVDLQVKNKINRDIFLRWATELNNVSISGSRLTLNAVSGQNMNLIEDTYIYDLQMNTGNINATYLKGELPIIGDITEI